MCPPSTSAEFDSLLDYLYNLQRLGIKVGLDHTSELLTRCETPQNHFKAIHVAGTNGKGSTSAVISSILRAAGLKVGLYTSPHLIRFNERIQVNGKPIDDGDIIRFIEAHHTDIDEIESTFFETTTGMAFQHFADEQVDVAVIETGLGGRLDSTNVINPEVTTITPISLDHREILGDDILTIAAEKGGIIKKGVPLVLSPQSSIVQEKLHKMAIKMEAPVTNVVAPKNIRLTEGGTEFEKNGDLYKIPLVGYHQALNASVGIEVVQSFMPQLEYDVLEAGVKMVRWPGRLQRMSEKYPIYYDVAHNAHGLQSILETVGHVFDQNPLGLFVLKGDKEADLVVRTLENQFEHLIISGAPELELMSGFQLSQKLSEFGLKDFTVIDSFHDALDRIIEIARKTGQPTLIFGSHYIAKAVFNKFGFLI